MGCSFEAYGKAMVRQARRLAAAAMVVTLAAAPAGAAELRGHGGPVRAIAAEAGAVITGSFDTRAILWDLETGAAEQVMHAHEGSVTAVAFLPDGMLVTAGQEGRIAFWRGGANAPAHVIEAHAGPITALAVAPSGRSLASSGWDAAGRVFALGPGAPEAVAVLEGHTDNVNGIAFLPDGGLVTAGYDASLRLWSAEGRPAGAVPVPAPLNAVAVDREGTIWTAAADGRLRAFAPDGTPLHEIGVAGAPLITLALAPRGDLLAAGSADGAIAVVATTDASLLRTIPASAGPIWALAFATDDLVLAGGTDHVVRAWDARTGAALGGPEERVAADFGEGRGAEVFRMCAACHTLDPDDGHRAGPTLHGIFGRRIASAEGYPYSAALRGMDIVWTPETVARLFEVGPMTMTPGTSMPEQRIPDPADRAALIEFLKEHTE